MGYKWIFFLEPPKCFFKTSFRGWMMLHIFCGLCLWDYCCYINTQLYGKNIVPYIWAYYKKNHGNGIEFSQWIFFIFYSLTLWHNYLGGPYTYTQLAVVYKQDGNTWNLNALSLQCSAPLRHCLPRIIWAMFMCLNYIRARLLYRPMMWYIRHESIWVICL